MSDRVLIYTFVLKNHKIASAPRQALPSSSVWNPDL